MRRVGIGCNVSFVDFVLLIYPPVFSFACCGFGKLLFDSLILSGSVCVLDASADLAIFPFLACLYRIALLTTGFESLGKYQRGLPRYMRSRLSSHLHTTTPPSSPPHTAHILFVHRGRDILLLDLLRHVPDRGRYNRARTVRVQRLVGGLAGYEL